MSEHGGFEINDLTGLSKPANTLIKKVSGAIGVWFEPYRITRKAEAEAKAKIILENAHLDIQRRAAQRLVAEETKNQENIESITTKAISHLNDHADASQIDDDWMTNFISGAKGVSTDKMQEIWAKILAGQANKTGQFSRKTINILGDLEARHLEVMEELSNLCIDIDFLGMGNHGNLEIPIYSDTDLMLFLSDPFDSAIVFKDLTLLGIIEYPAREQYTRILKDGAKVSYHGKIIKVRPKELGHDTTHFNTGVLALTKWGNELMKLCHPEHQSGFWSYVLDNWGKFGYEIEDIST